jgi:hypothetical protein
MPNSFRLPSESSSEEEEKFLHGEEVSSDNRSITPTPPSSPLWTDDEWEEKAPSESGSDISAALALAEMHPAVTPDEEGETDTDDEDEDEEYDADVEDCEHRPCKKIKTCPSPTTLVKSIGESSSRNNIEDAPPGFKVHNNVQDDAGEEPNTIDSSDDE